MRRRKIQMSARPKIREYQPIWEALKSTGKTRLSVPIPYQPRVRKAVLKEKYNDLGFKVLLAETHQTARLEIETHGAMMIFTLIKSIGIGDI